MYGARRRSGRFRTSQAYARPACRTRRQQGDPNPFVTAARLSLACSRRPRQRYCYYPRGASRTSGRGHPDLDLPRRATPLHAPRRSPSIGTRRDNLGAAAGGELARGALLWQLKAYRGSRNFGPCRVGDFDCNAPSGARPNLIDGTFPLDDLNGQALLLPVQQEGSRQYSQGGTERQAW